MNNEVRDTPSVEVQILQRDVRELNDALNVASMEIWRLRKAQMTTRMVLLMILATMVIFGCSQAVIYGMLSQ